MNILLPSDSWFGIGFDNAADSSAKLEIDGNGTTVLDLFKVSSDADVNPQGDRFVVKNNGKVGIGTNAPSEALEVSGNVKATAFISTSDERLKENVAPAEGLSKVLKLKGVQYDWIKNGFHDYGLIAQAVELIFPSAVVTDTQTGFKAIKYQNLISPIIESIKDLYRMITGTNEEVKVLKRDIASVKAQNDKLAKENLALKERFLSLEERLNKLERNKR